MFTLPYLLLVVKSPYIFDWRKKEGQVYREHIFNEKEGWQEPGW